MSDTWDDVTDNPLKYNGLWENQGKTLHANFGLRGLLLATFAKPSTNFTNSLPSFFAFVSGLWLKTDAGPRDGKNKKW